MVKNLKVRWRWMRLKRYQEINRKIFVYLDGDSDDIEDFDHRPITIDWKGY